MQGLYATYHSCIFVTKAKSIYRLLDCKA